jgi:hypothetical protein
VSAKLRADPRDRFPSSSVVRILTPVVLLPGRASEATSAEASISSAMATIGTVRVTCCAARIGRSPPQTRTSTPELTEQRRPFLVLTARGLSSRRWDVDRGDGARHGQSCFGTHHPQFGYDANDTLWLSGSEVGIYPHRDAAVSIYNRSVLSADGSAAHLRPSDHSPLFQRRPQPTSSSGPHWLVSAARSSSISMPS